MHFPNNNSNILRIADIQVTGKAFYNMTKPHVSYYLPAEPETTDAPTTTASAEETSTGSPQEVDHSGAETTTVQPTVSTRDSG